MRRSSTMVHTSVLSVFIAATAPAGAPAAPPQYAVRYLGEAVKIERISARAGTPVVQCAAADVNRDGSANVNDLVMVITNWG